MVVENSSLAVEMNLRMPSEVCEGMCTFVVSHIVISKWLLEKLELAVNPRRHVFCGM